VSKFVKSPLTLHPQAFFGCLKGRRWLLTACAQLIIVRPNDGF
jgi:hypothetical protein